MRQQLACAAGPLQRLVCLLLEPGRLGLFAGRVAMRTRRLDRVRHRFAQRGQRLARQQRGALGGVRPGLVRVALGVERRQSGPQLGLFLSVFARAVSEPAAVAQQRLGGGTAPVFGQRGEVRGGVLLSFANRFQARFGGRQQLVQLGLLHQPAPPEIKPSVLNSKLAQPLGGARGS